MKVCSVEGCEKVSHAKGFCVRHYNQIRRYGKIISVGVSKYDPNKFVVCGEIVTVDLCDSFGRKISEFTIDIGDLPIVENNKWHLGKNGYVLNQKNILLHRLLLGKSCSMKFCDHIDRDRTNNRRSNLRPATCLENNHNVGLKTKNTSGFMGVTRDKGKWQAGIVINGKRKHIGNFADPIEAAKAYDNAVIFHRGEYFGVTNQSLGLY